ncbi:hypothetical protein [Winkia neuii]|uniref:hypothetical protein n=1 Tax=Winkia neuii TaxID=33007 RepID=UPI0023A9357B|nr:hypothetical protein [Winkia neuii]WEB72773.1 hypothetical protein PUW51_00270 [Winkia neuii]
MSIPRSLYVASSPSVAGFFRGFFSVSSPNVVLGLKSFGSAALALFNGTVSKAAITAIVARIAVKSVHLFRGKLLEISIIPLRLAIYIFLISRESRCSQLVFYAEHTAPDYGPKAKLSISLLVQFEHYHHLGSCA